MKRLLTLTGLVALLSTLVLAADAAGTWSGAFDFDGTSVPLTLSLKSGGDAVTGTVDGLPGGQSQIHDGKVKEDVITFWILTDYQGSTYKLIFHGKQSADRIQFDFGTEDGSFSDRKSVV